MAYSPEDPISLSQLNALLSAPASHQTSGEGLVEKLSDHEPEVCLLWTATSVTGELELVRTFYASFLIAHLLVDDINEARFLTQRFPPNLSTTDPVLVECKKLLQAVWSRNFPVVYELLQPERWPDPLETLISRYLIHFRRSIFRHLSDAYTSMPPGLAGMYLGIGEGAESEEDIVAKLTLRGWQWDAVEKILRPALTTNTLPDASQVNNESASDSMARLVSLVGFLGE